MSLKTTERRSTPISTLSRAAFKPMSVTVISAGAPREQRGFVDEVRQIRAREPGRSRAMIRRSVSGSTGMRRVDAQNCLAAFEIRIADRDLPIESSRTEKRRVEDVGPVGGGDDDDPCMRLEAVHFDQQLIEGLLALFVAERTAAAASPDGVELVDKDDARRVAAGILEEPHAGRSHAGIHLDEVRTTGEQERDARLPRDRPRQERFARARGRRGGCFGDASADCHKAIWLAQEIDDFFDFVFGLVDARHVFERDDAIALLGDTRAARDGRNAPGRGPIDSEREERQKRCDRRRRAPTERSGRGRESPRRESRAGRDR